MTRFTKMTRKTHIEATGWAELKTKGSDSQFAASSSANITKESQKEFLESGALQATTVTEANATSKRKDTEDSSDQTTKKKRVRHRSAIAKDDDKNKPDEGNKSISNTVNRSEGALSRKEREVLKRRSRREKIKEKMMTCFLCRQPGHSIKFCPRSPDSAKPISHSDKSAAKSNDGDDIDLNAIAAEMEKTPMEGICYKCGSTEHKSSQCKKKLNSVDNLYPFASCFVCKGIGHLASMCPQNERGMYPNGGSCKFCGSVKHLASQCKPASMEGGVSTVGVIDLSQGGDDDDVFAALKKMKDSGVEEKKAEPTNDTSSSIASRRVAKKTMGKKVVTF
ncbi:Zinc finger CCHC domain-containing protein 9 [Physocladia obscura]|uniref:Zinc finger CCHC domain-containing protein 9 n=1 Tax=Physocladia obscura TaxID=109957 RepID=A0AAD5TAD4_9FUNG|nr:Zinc finger CCHC domain-containing protein 9 [Physocladia obscura]